MNERQRIWLRRGLLFLALLFVGMGTVRGEMAVVFTKAVNICLECIGIG